jgi:acetyl esterase
MTAPAACEFDVEDVEYLRHRTGPLLARLFRPRTQKPTAAIIEIHGGAWSKFDRTRGRTVHEALARRGIFVMALDFRQAEEGAYPLMLQDISYAVRWLKANAATFGVDPGRIGLSGNSSGGHAAMLTAMRPNDPRYAALPLPAGSPDVDATVRCVALLWPVIDPLGRYRHVKALQEAERPDWTASVIEGHDAFWTNEANMADGSPSEILKKGERVLLPPALWIQPTNDGAHNYPNAESGLPQSEDFVGRYRAAGGDIELITFEAPMMFATAHPTLPESIAALERLGDFILRETR